MRQVWNNFRSSSGLEPLYGLLHLPFSTELTALLKPVEQGIHEPSYDPTLNQDYIVSCPVAIFVRCCF